LSILLNPPSGFLDATSVKAVIMATIPKTAGVRSWAKTIVAII
jgi:hypothetical protein